MRAEVKETGGVYLGLKAVRLRYLDTQLSAAMFWVPPEIDVNLLEDLLNDALMERKPEDD